MVTNKICFLYTYIPLQCEYLCMHYLYWLLISAANVAFAYEVSFFISSLLQMQDNIILQQLNLGTVTLDPVDKVTLPLIVASPNNRRTLHIFDNTTFFNDRWEGSILFQISDCDHLAILSFYHEVSRSMGDLEISLAKASIPSIQKKDSND